jgi:hypothetical protein
MFESAKSPQGLEFPTSAGVQICFLKAMCFIQKQNLFLP